MPADDEPTKREQSKATPRAATPAESKEMGKLYDKGVKSGKIAKHTPQHRKGKGRS